MRTEDGERSECCSFGATINAEGYLFLTPFLVASLIAGIGGQRKIREQRELP